MAKFREIERGDVRRHGPETLGVARQHDAHQQPAVAEASDSEPRSRRHPGVDQVIRSRPEIVKHVVLVVSPSGLMPLAPKFAAAAYVRYRVDTTSAHPVRDERVIPWEDRLPPSAIPI